MPDERPKWNLILQFDDQSPSFSYGFQAGQIWQSMVCGVHFETQFSGEILELVQRMPVRKNYTFEIKDIGNGWYYLKGTPEPGG